MKNNVLSDKDKYRLYQWIEDKNKAGVQYKSKDKILADVKTELGLTITVHNLDGAVSTTGIYLWDKQSYFNPVVVQRANIHAIQNELALHKHVLKNIVLLMNKEGFEVSPEMLNFCKSVQPPAAVQ